MYGIVQRKSNPNFTLVLSLLLISIGVVSGCIVGFAHLSVWQMLTPFLGLVILIAWFRVRNQFTKSYLKSPQLHHPIRYTFTEEGIQVAGHQFTAEACWAPVQRMDVVKGFVLLYTSNRAAQLIRESSLTVAQLQAIKEKSIAADKH